MINMIKTLPEQSVVHTASACMPLFCLIVHTFLTIVLCFLLYLLCIFFTVKCVYKANLRISYNVIM